MAIDLIASEAVLSRAQGSLLGQLAGDSLGGLVEFQAPNTIRARYPNGVRDLANGGTWQTIAGQPTDDSELALALARSLVGADSYQADKAACAYAGWYRSGPFDIGNATRKSLGAAARALAKGEDPRAAAREAADPHTQANGALMRVSPLGIFGWRHPSPLVGEWAQADAASHPVLGRSRRLLPEPSRCPPSIGWATPGIAYGAPCRPERPKPGQGLAIRRDP